MNIKTYLTINGQHFKNKLVYTPAVSSYQPTLYGTKIVVLTLTRKARLIGSENVQTKNQVENPTAKHSILRGEI